MVNLFACRATKPKDMKAHHAPVGRENDHWLLKAVKEAGVVVAAWGNHGGHLSRGEAVTRLLAGRLTCLGVTKKGHPMHPSRLNKTLTPIPFG
jgi:hypothetical protein